MTDSYRAKYSIESIVVVDCSIELHLLRVLMDQQPFPDLCPRLDMS